MHVHQALTVNLELLGAPNAIWENMGETPFVWSAPQDYTQTLVVPPNASTAQVVKFLICKPRHVRNLPGRPKKTASLVNIWTIQVLTRLTILVRRACMVQTALGSPPFRH